MMDWQDAYRTWVGSTTETPIVQTEDENEHEFLRRIFDRAVREAFHAGWELRDEFGDK